MSSPESESESNSRPPYKTPASLIAFTLIVLVVFFMAFAIVFVFRYCFVSVIHTWVFQRTASGSLIRFSPNRSPPTTGLDPSMLQIFPTFHYANVKELREEKYSLECAICLLEFEDDSILRLLTVCCHVFHQECIDLWLYSHKTCPVCRRDLDSPTTNQEVQQISADNQENEVCSTSDDVHIDIRGEEGDGDGDGGCGENAGDQTHEHEHEYEHEHEHEHEHDDNGEYPVFVSISGKHHQDEEEEQRFSRSHSTGHSIVLIRGGEEKDNDKYTLRLPEHVITRHNCTRSCSNYR